jgi:3-hydroxybutyryl-CoA dehydrogenase
MPDVAVVGPGRMGVGIAQALVLAGRDVALVDVKERSAGESEAALETARAQVESGLALLASIGVEPAGPAQVAYRSDAEADDALAEAVVVFEAVPETREAKETAYRRIAASPGLVGSTTSTFGVDDLAAHVGDRSRFMNTHWLNPAPLMPLVEVMPGAATSTAAVEEMESLLRALGKVPVRCKASAGYIVPRIQALAMNEAARLVEEGVATAEDVDTACRLGFGVRFATLGLLEFVDWGGADILLYASNYLSGALGSDRYAAPDILVDKVETGSLFRDVGSVDPDEYRREKLRALVALLEHLELRQS